MSVLWWQLDVNCDKKFNALCKNLESTLSHCKTELWNSCFCSLEKILGSKGCKLKYLYNLSELVYQNILKVYEKPANNAVLKNKTKQKLQKKQQDAVWNENRCNKVKRENEKNLQNMLSEIEKTCKMCKVETYIKDRMLQQMRSETYKKR